MSKEAKFTSGPWHVDEYCTQVHIVGSDNNATCKVMSLHSKAKANAHLIAAAPEMYEALEKLLDKYRSSVSYEKGHDYDLSDMAESALAKARGES